MEPASAWNSLEVVKLLVSILTPLTIAILGYLVNKRFHDSELKHEQDRDNEQHRREEEKNRREAEEQKKREEKEAQEKARQEELTRVYKPHIEFDIGCRFFGPLEGRYAVEFLLTANNRGTTRHEFRSIILRVRGIRHDEPLAYWTKCYEYRLLFPIKIIEDEVIPKKALNFIFVEPGVKQCLNYQTIIEVEIKYITAHAEFFYDPETEYTPHSTEKMFEVRGNV